MKKFLTSLVIMAFTSLSANATTQVFYGNTGAPTSATYGSTYNRSVDNFGSNAGFAPQNIQKREAIERAKKHEDQYYNGLEKGRSVNINTTTINNNNSTTDNPKQRKFVKNKFLKNKLLENKE